MDGSASLAIGETFAGRVVKVKHHDDDDDDDDDNVYDGSVDGDWHGGKYHDNDDNDEDDVYDKDFDDFDDYDDDPGATGGRPGGQGGEGRYQQVLEGDGRREQQSRYHDDYGDDNDNDSIII